VSSSKDEINSIAIFGCHIFPGKHANLGVYALCESLCILLNKKYPKARLTLLDCHSSNDSTHRIETEDNTLVLDLVKWHLSLKKNISNNLLFIFFLSIVYKLIPIKIFRASIENRNDWIKTLGESDFVVDVRGGDSFSDIYGLGRFIRGHMQLLTATILGKRVVLLPQTYGPFKSSPSKIIARQAFGKVEQIYARDRESLKTASNYTADKSRVHLSPDLAFYLPRSKTGLEFIHPTCPQNGRLTIGININGLMYNGGYNKNNMFGLNLDYKLFISLLTKRIQSYNKYNILLVPHTITPSGIIESDNDACEETFNKIESDHTFIARDTYSCQEAKNIISACDYFIGSRMHSCIASLSQGIPTIGLAYSKKFRGVFESVGVKEWVIDARSVETTEAVSLCLRALETNQKQKDELKASIANAKRELEKITEGLGQRKE